MKCLLAVTAAPPAETPVAWVAWLAATAHAATVILRRSPFGALDTLALALALGIPWSLARTAPRRQRGTQTLARTPYRGDGG